MGTTSKDEPLIKYREIWFRGPHHQGAQATGAAEYIQHVPGVIHASARSGTCLHVEYDLRYICLRVVRRHLQLAGFHLDAALLEKLKIALLEYAEENQRESLGLEGCQLPTQAFTQTPETRLVAGKRSVSAPERSDDPWRHYQ